MNDKVSQAPLTLAQRRLVADNIGLVGLHLRKRVAPTRQPTRSREHEDLFQEGCLGLMQAARLYDPASGIAFAAFALPRIHTAVTRALRASFHTVSVPIYPRSRSGEVVDPPAVLALDFDPTDERNHAQGVQDDEGGCPTLGDRLRARHDVAIRRAAADSKRAHCKRDDRHVLIDRLIEDRLGVPEPSAKSSLRDIARQTESSYSRVLQAERRLLRDIKRHLEADEIVGRLRITARHDPRGFDAPHDPGVDREDRDHDDHQNRDRSQNRNRIDALSGSPTHRRTAADCDAPRRRNRPARSRSLE